MKNNTIVTIGDLNYLWGIFLLICSMRKNGMDEPVLVGTSGFAPEAVKILTQLDDVTVFPLENVERSLTCYKPLVMLQAQTEYITWADGDGYFSGNCSELLIPRREDEIHIRMRSADENRRAFRGRIDQGEPGWTIPRAVLDAWRADTGMPPSSASGIGRSCSACFLSVHRSARPFLRKWHEQMEKVLPTGNTGVVDRSLKYYHQLDESVLNSLLAFSPLAPRIAPEYRMDKFVDARFIHFVGIPKPWENWSCRTFRHFDTYTSVAAYALDRGFRLPGNGMPPFPLKPENRMRCALLRLPVSLAYKARGVVKRIRKPDNP